MRGGTCLCCRRCSCPTNGPTPTLHHPRFTDWTRIRLARGRSVDIAVTTSSIVGGGSPGRAIQQGLAPPPPARPPVDRGGTPSTSLLLGRRAKALEGGSVFADGAT